MTDAMQELKAMKIWFLYQLKPRPDGRLNKVPFSALGGVTGTSDKYAGTWVDYEEAEKAKTKLDTDVGLGFKIPAGFFFLDIDHREASSPFVQQQLERFNSYAERSVSGGGIHIYGKYDLSRIPHYMDKDGKPRLDRQFYMKNPGSELELYFGELTNRYAAYTGDVVLEQPLKDCTDALLLTLDKGMRRKEKKRLFKAEQDDQGLFDIVSNLRRQKNGEKFRALYDAGDISTYASQSEADAALCAMLAFRTGDDPELIDQLFRTSALMRDKWEREDYRESTIKLGIEVCKGNFHSSVMPHPPFIQFDQHAIAHVSVPLLARYIREHLHYMLVRDLSTGATLKYVYENGRYRYYSDDMMRGVIKSFIAEYDEELIKMGQVNETLQHLQTDLNTFTADQLNDDEDLINFENGLLRLSDLELLPHSPDVRSTIQIPCRWSGQPSPTPVFDGYMQTLTNGATAIILLILQFMGACFSNVKGWRMKKALFLVGLGDTGKSVIKSLVERILGALNFIGIDLSEIEARFGTSAIYGKRLAGSSDMSFVTVKELKTFKKCTGGDSLFAEYKGLSPFQFTYNGLLWFCMNKLPKFGGDDGQWVYNRIIEVQCKNVIPEDQQDKQLLDKLYAEREGIVYKAIMAFRTVVQNGYRFTEPESVKTARQLYRERNSTVISFYDECTMQRVNGKISDGCTTGKVYKVYRAWCQDNNNGYAKTMREFREDLAEHLDSEHADLITRQKGNSYYKDFTLNQETKEQYRKDYGYDDYELLG